MTNQILTTSIDGAAAQRSAGPSTVEPAQAERDSIKSFRDVLQFTEKGHDGSGYHASKKDDNTATTALEDEAVQGDWVLLDELPNSLTLTEGEPGEVVVGGAPVPWVGAEVLGGRYQWRAAGGIPLQQNAATASLNTGGERILVDDKGILPFAQSASKSNKLTAPTVMLDATTAELSTDRNTQFTLRSSTLLPPGGWQMQGEAVTKDLLLQQRHLDANFNSVTETDFHIPFGSEAISASGEPALGTPMLDDTLSTGFKGRIQIPLNMQFSHSQRSNGVAEKTAALISQNINSAEIQMDPPELGPLQVRIQVHQDQASVTFVTANPQVRDALDASLLRLKDMLQEQGLQLVDSGVSDQSAEEKQQHSGSSSGSGEPLGGPLGSQEDADETEVSSSGVVHWGVDYFA